MLARSPLILLLTLALACDDATAPAPSIAGAWDIVGYMDQGITAATTGIADFRPDSTFATAGTITFPGEPVDTQPASSSRAPHPDTPTQGQT